MAVITGSKTALVVEEPILRIEAKAKTKKEEETLVTINFLGRYAPDIDPDAKPNAECLEALEYVAEVALTAYQRYKALYLDEKLAQERTARIGDEKKAEEPDPTKGFN